MSVSNLSDLSKIRLLIQHEGKFRRVCKLIFTRNDASIYIVPYAPGGHYYFGSNRFAQREARRTFNFKEQLSSKDEQRLPHISLHEKGQVHAYVTKDQQAGPLQIPPLREWRGQHIATVTIDRFNTLAPFDNQPKSTGAEQDFVFNVEESAESGRLALYLNGAKQSFDDDCLVVTLTRPTLKQPLYLAIWLGSQEPLGEIGSRGGVTAIAGWDPTTAKTEAEASFLYVRGE